MPQSDSTAKINASAKHLLGSSESPNLFSYYRTTIKGVHPTSHRWAGGQTVFYQTTNPRLDCSGKVRVFCVAYGTELILYAEKIIVWRIFPHQKTPKGRPRKELVYNFANGKMIGPKQ